MNDRKAIDVQVIFHKKEQRTLSAGYQFYCGKELEGAHGAEADTNATYEILLAQLDKYEDIGNTVDALSDYSTHLKEPILLGLFYLMMKIKKFFHLENIKVELLKMF